MSLSRKILGCVAAFCIAMPLFAADQIDNQQQPSQSTEQQKIAANDVATAKPTDMKAADKSADMKKDQAAMKTVNINTATAEELMAVKGIGKKRAEAIIKYRDQHGAFKTVDDLSAVKGINKKFVEKNRSQLTVG